MSNKLCLASCFLPFDEENTRWWMDFQGELAAQGIDLVLISQAAPADLRLRTIVVPLWFHGYWKAYGLQPGTITLEEPLALALAKRDRAWSAQEARNLSEFTAGLSVCQQVLRTLLKELEPSIVLVWGSSLPQSVVLQQMAIQQGRPCWILERGLLPGTLMLEMCGHGGHSELNWSFTVRQALQKANKMDLFTAAQKAYKSSRTSKYSQAGIADPASFRRRFNPDRCKIISLLLQHDASAAMVPTDYLGARIHAPEILSSPDSIRALSDIVAQTADCRLIVKPHPMDHGDYSSWGNRHVTVCRDVHLHTLLEASDVVACMTSSTQFEALLYEKPVLLLAHSPLVGKGIAYEAPSAEQLPAALKAALNRENICQRLTAGRRFVHFLLSNFSVALTDNSQAVPKLRDLASFLMQNAVVATSPQTVDQRLDAVGKWFSQWESAARHSGPAAIENGSRNADSQNKTSERSHGEFLLGRHLLEVFRVRDRAAFTRLLQGHFEQMILEQDVLLPAGNSTDPFRHAGHCVVCGGEREFTTDFMFSKPDAQGRVRPSWRERQICTCMLNCRQRSCFHFLTQALGLSANSVVYCTEQMTELFRRIQKVFPNALGSEYLGDRLPLGQTNCNGVRNEDITRLTFPEASFDCIFSLDVMEHVPNYKAGLCEMARCLKQGGKLLLTAPFHFNLDQTVVRASVNPDGTLTHHLPPLYHGDPLDSKGALCFNDFGWDIMEDLRAAGFPDATVFIFTAPYYGYVGLQYIILATRGPVENDDFGFQFPSTGVTAGRLSPRMASLEPVLPSSTGELHQQAAVLCREGKWDKAEPCFRTLTNLEPGQVEGWKGWLECARKLNHRILENLIRHDALQLHPEWAGVLANGNKSDTGSEELALIKPNEISTTFWQCDESLREAGDRLSDLRCGIRVVSFDIFDTLVCRICGKPDDLFIEVGRRLAAQGLLARPFTPMEFHSARLAADSCARQKAVSRGHPSEIKLADIYVELKEVLTDSTAACAVEFEVERNYCFLNPAVASLARHAKALGYKVVAISDTYFTAAQLQQLLRENGFLASLFDVIMTSCECGKAKWNGQLYHELFRHFDIHPAELMHLGDNELADIEVARQYGVRTVHYYKTNSTLARQLLAERKMRSSDLHLAGSLDSIRILIARRAKSDQDAFRDGAFIFGPVLARYADWCVEKFKAANVHTVLALMREGELLGELVRRSAVAAGVELKIVTCFTSRRATARASISDLTPTGIMELFEGSSTVTLQSIFEVLGMDEEIARQFDPKVLSKTLSVDNSLAEVLTQLFKNPRAHQLLKDKCAESYALAFDYFKSLTGGDPRVGILDIGLGGSIQRNIARILRRGGQNVITIGCYLARTSKSGRLALNGDEVHAFMEQDWNRITILPELAVSSPVGSTNGYERDATGAVKPVLGECKVTPAEKNIRGRIRDGILEFQAFWLNMRKQKHFSLETLADLDRQTASIFYRLLEFPSKSEAGRLGGLTHDENYFGENLTAPLCEEPAARMLRREGVQTMIQTSRCHWPQGLLARDYPRLVNALGLGWSDVAAMGCLGAWHGTPIGEGSLTDEEVAALGILVGGLGLRQMILVGSLVPTIAEVFQFLWQEEKEDHLQKYPRVIIVGSEGGWAANPEFLKRCAFVNGDLNDPRTVHAVRAALVPGGSAALALSGELPETTLSGLLNGLTPFLGREGAVLVACGRYDRNAIWETLPAAKTIKAWLHANACELGFGLWIGPTALRAQLDKWLVLRRGLAHVFWNNQWMFNVDDLALAETTEDLLMKP
jgi:predicted HAD superfamily hydrolase/SAM-dependent methyltransferase